VREERNIPKQANIHSPELFNEAYGGRRPEAFASLLAGVIVMGNQVLSSISAGG